MAFMIALSSKVECSLPRPVNPGVGRLLVEYSGQII
jgi:hypothetical protein